MVDFDLSFTHYAHLMMIDIHDVNYLTWKMYQFCDMKSMV